LLVVVRFYCLLSNSKRNRQALRQAMIMMWLAGWLLLAGGGACRPLPAVGCSSSPFLALFCRPHFEKIGGRAL